MDWSAIEISITGLQRSANTPRAELDISPARRIHPSPEKKTNSDIALVSLKNQMLSRRSFQGDPTRKLTFAADKSDDAGSRVSDMPPSELLTPAAGAGDSDLGLPGRIQRELAASSRHITFPGTSMKLPDGTFRFATDEELDIIKGLFPQACEFRVFGPIFAIVFHELPPKPWPLTIGGMPAYFTTDAKKLPIPHGFGGLNGRVLCDCPIKVWDTPTDAQMDSIFECFNQDLGICVESVLWLGFAFYITVPLGTKRRDVPAMVLGLICTYGFPHPLPRKEAALRHQQLMGTVCDDSNYQRDLRPGLMLSCGVGSNNELLTSSGVPVKKEGKHLVTVASHSFPFGEETVWHPNSGGTVIGQVKETLGTSDISLMELRPGYEYRTQTFGAAQYPGTALQKFRHHMTLKIGDPVYLDSPFSGSTSAVVCGWQRLDTGQLSDPEDRYITVEWIYCGNDLEEPLEGMCGSAIWDDDGNVIGFFRFADDDGMAKAISAAQLMEQGWEIEAIEAIGNL